MRHKYVVYGLLVIIVYFVVTVIGGVRDFGSLRGNDATEQEIVVGDGATLSSIMPQLQEKLGVRPFWMKVYVKLSGAEGLQPGTFTVEKNASYTSILAALAEVETSEVVLTIPEGFSLAQIGARVVEKFPSITLEEWTQATGVHSPLVSHPFVAVAEKPDNVDLEGYLFPDTYRFFADVTAEEIATTMLDTMAAKYGEVAPAVSVMSPHEYLTLASVVEKEVRQAETRRVVAGIFMNRLDIGMPLQSDATINYVIDGDDPSPTLEDLQVESLYNTYKYAGLPPGPIANPGLTALQATLNPAVTDYYYFLTTDEGAIHYAVTHDQHVENKYLYLK